MAATQQEVRIENLEPWEKRSWLPDGDDLPDWIAEARAKHIAKIEQFEADFTNVVELTNSQEDAARDWRRAVRSAVAAGKDPPPREIDDEVAAAQVEIASDDLADAREAVAEIVVQIIAEVRSRRPEFEPYFNRASPELRAALGTGTQGLIAEAEATLRGQIEKLNAEVAIPDIDDPANADLTKLGNQEASSANAA